MRLQPAVRFGVYLAWKLHTAARGLPARVPGNVATIAEDRIVGNRLADGEESGNAVEVK